MQARFKPLAHHDAVRTRMAGTLSYSELERQTARLANALAYHRVRVGDRVAVQVEKSVEALVLYLSCLRSGAIFVPINTAYKARETVQILDDAAPSLIVCGSDREAALRDYVATSGLNARLATLNADGSGSLSQLAAEMSPQHECAPLGGEDPAVILYTSGTTGRPKGAILSNRALLTNAETLVGQWSFTPQDVLLHCLPLFHAHGLFVAANVALLAGATMLWVERFDADEVISRFSDTTVFMGIPTLYSRLLSSKRLTAENCHRVRLFLSGSAPLSENMFEQFFSRTGIRIVERYGMTETGINSSNPIDGPRVAGTVGLPLPGIEIRAVDIDGNRLSNNDTGEIQIRGPNLFSGYWNRNEEYLAAMSPDGWFSTGDVGRFDQNGYLALLSRKKDVIITGGYNVYPAEIETVLESLTEIAEAAVFGVPHHDFGEGVAAAVVLRKGYESNFNEARILAQLKTRLANYKIPKRIVTIASLPRNPMGKILKPELRAKYSTMFSAPNP